MLFWAQRLPTAVKLRGLRHQSQNLGADEFVVQYNVSGLQHPQCFQGEQLGIARSRPHQKYFAPHESPSLPSRRRKGFATGELMEEFSAIFRFQVASQDLLARPAQLLDPFGILRSELLFEFTA